MRCFDKVSNYNWLPACDCSTVIDNGFLSGCNFIRLLADLLFDADMRLIGPHAVSQVFHCDSATGLGRCLFNLYGIILSE